MGRKRELEVQVTAEQLTAIEVLLHRQDLTRRLRERLEMVRAAAMGQDLAWIAKWSGRSTRTVRFWLERFQEEGLEALADAPRPGRPARADAAYRQALERAMDTLPPTLDLPFDAWTSARLSAYLAKTTGVRIAPGWIRVLLHQADFVRGRPKHTLKHLQDPEAVAASKAELAEAGKKGGGRPHAV
jgi:transposase